MLKLVNRNSRPTVRSTDWTPKTPCCAQAGKRCAPDPKAWQSSTWSTLGFSIDEPHLFQYRVQIEGSGAATRYVVEARGDLDCDGQLSSLKRTVSPNDAPGPIESKDEIE